MKYPVVNKALILYPFLFAVFPILFLYEHNIGQVSPMQIVFPMIVSICFTLVLWVMLSLICGNVLKGGLATSLFLFFFFFYGRFYELLEKWNVCVPRHEVLLFEVLLLWGFCVYCIKIASKDFKNISKSLNTIAVVLIIISVFTIALHEIMQSKSASSEMYGPQKTVTENPSKLKNRPDIYFIVLDEYAHPATMREYYNYDNSQFIRNLENKGFFVAQGSRTRAFFTFFSISLTLNMEYHIGETKFSTDIYRRIAHNRVAAYLRARGYQFIYFGGWYDIGKIKVSADRYYNFSFAKEGLFFWKELADEFNRILADTTMLKIFYLNLMEKYFLSYREGTIRTIEQLKKIQSIKGPKFTFAHIMCPHQPFVFGPSGEQVDSANWYNYKDKQFYRGQYIFITREIEKVIDVLLKNSAAKPIIIIQSDHGLRLFRRGLKIDEDEWQKIFNAYYLPGDGKKYLYKTISPVNSFRVIFNHYFGAKYKLLDD